MMRRTRIPHVVCGSTRVAPGPCARVGRHGVAAFALGALFGACLQLLPGMASDVAAQATILPVPPQASGQFGTVTPQFGGPQPAPFGGNVGNRQGNILGPAPKIDNAAPLYLQGDQLIYDTRGNKVTARGNVEIYYNNFVLTADEVTYDQSANKLTARGNAQLKDPNGNITRGEVIESTDDFRDAFIQSLSVVTRDDTRIAAQRAIRRDGNVTEFEQGKFTPCKSDQGQPPLWCISAARIVHDQQAATISYQDAQFELFGVPIFYLPYFQHADPSVKRRSGFLTPTVSSSTQLGIGTTIPYYFALAPNYDFLFQPTYYTKQGLFLHGTFRHRLENGQYTVKLAGINQDAANLPAGTVNANKLDGFRGTVETRGVFSIGSWWKFGWDVTVESDSTFRRFYKLDNILQTDRVNTAFLTGIGDRNYFSATLYQFGGLLLNDSPTAASRVHPVIDYNYIFGNGVLGGELSSNLHVRSMTRNDGTDSTHAVAEFNWRKKIIDGLGQVWTPFAGARGDIYSYGDVRNPDNLASFAKGDTVARINAVAGLQYSYPFVAQSSFGSHILAPTAQITLRPNQTDQRRLPNEDAKSLVWDDTLLFSIPGKFSGFDRQESGTRADAGVQYTFSANNGFNLRAVLGQSFQLAGTNAYNDPGLDVTASAATSTATNFSGLTGLQKARSDYVAGVYISPLRNFSLISQSRFDSNDFQLRREDLAATLTAGPVFAQAAYSFLRADPALGLLSNQQDLLGSVGLRLTDNWSILGSARYDLATRQILQDALSLRYNDECFILTTTYTETFISNPALDIRPDRTLMLRFELKHVGDFSFKTDAVSGLFGDNQPQTPR